MADGDVLIQYGATPCDRGGFYPFYTNNGREHSNWKLSGADRDEALREARSMAEAEAAHYAGDWSITIEMAP